MNGKPSVVNVICLVAEKVEEQGKIRSSERVSNQVQFEYYDVTEKTTYLITYTEITDDIGAKYITETVSPIK